MQVDHSDGNVTCTCDFCDNTFIYRGNPTHAPGIVQAAGWSVGRVTGIARCTACVAAYGMCLYETLRRLVTQ